MSTKQLQSIFENHSAFRDRGPRFRVFTTALILFHLLAMLTIWIYNIFN